MGGRGSSSVFLSSAKKQLREMAKEGIMPRFLAGGTPEDRGKLFEEINRLYPMPDTQEARRIVDMGDGVHVHFSASSTRASYPRGHDATEAEKQGALKFLLYNSQNKRGNK